MKLLFLESSSSSSRMMMAVLLGSLLMIIPVISTTDAAAFTTTATSSSRRTRWVRLGGGNSASGSTTTTTTRRRIRYHQGQQEIRRHRPWMMTSLSSSSSSTTSTFDYEYIIPPDRSQTQTQPSFLKSSFPPNTPAGLRGEAIRSALLQGASSSDTSHCCCVGWKFDDNTSPLKFGLIRIKGNGCTQFLNNKLSISFNNQQEEGQQAARFSNACLLDGKGRAVDVLGVVTSTEKNQEAFVLTSPGHSSRELYQKWDKLIFPLDEVTIEDLSTTKSSTTIFTLASCSYDTLQTIFQKCILPTLQKHYNNRNLSVETELPQRRRDECSVIRLLLDDGDDDDQDQDKAPLLLIAPTCQLPESGSIGGSGGDGDDDGKGAVITGYTFAFLNCDDDGDTGTGQQIWDQLVGLPESADDEDEDETTAQHNTVIELGPLEYNTLRIELGYPGYGYEMIAGIIEDKKKKGSSTYEEGTASNSKEESVRVDNNNMTPPSPFELSYLNQYVDLDKGCYLGQEGIASIIKNPRGPPRSLYYVKFEDDSNLYNDYQTVSEQTTSSKTKVIKNTTRQPRQGDELYVLGSNSEIKVGQITSLAEPGGTNQPCTLGLALIRRSDSILKQMNNMDLQIPMTREEQDKQNGGGPNLRSPLDGLEVIVGGTMTVGTLHAITQPGNANKEGGITVVEADKAVSSSSTATSTSSSTDNDEEEEEEQQLKAAAEKAKVEAEAAAAAEAKRKADKMEMLRQRAEEAMAKRRNKKKQNNEK